MAAVLCGMLVASTGCTIIFPTIANADNSENRTKQQKIRIFWGAAFGGQILDVLIFAALSSQLLKMAALARLIRCHPEFDSRALPAASVGRRSHAGR